MEKIKRKRKKLQRDYYELEERSRLNSNVRDITRPIDTNDAIKFELCNHIIAYMRRHGLKQKEMVSILKDAGAKVDEGKISLIKNLKYSEFKSDRLFLYVGILAKSDELTRLFLNSKLETPMQRIDILMHDPEYVEKKIAYIEDHDDLSEEFVEAPEEIFDLLAS